MCIKSVRVRFLCGKELWGVNEHTSVYIHMKAVCNGMYRVCANDCVSVSASICVNICTHL